MRKSLVVLLCFISSFALGQLGQSTPIRNGSATPSVTTTGPGIFNVNGTAAYICYKTTCLSTDWVSITPLVAANAVMKGSGAGVAPVASSITDNGTTVSTTEPVAIGTANCTTFGTAGGLCMGEGTAPTNVASTTACYPDSTTHEMQCATAGSSTFGILNRTAGSVNLTGQTATKTISTACAASAGACNVAGLYELNYTFWGSGTACSSVTAGKVVLTFTWTDENGVSHSAIPAPISFDQKAAAANVTGTFNFNTTLATEGAYGAIPISSNGAAAIQYTATYTACTTGTGTYNLRIATTRLQ